MSARLVSAADFAKAFDHAWAAVLQEAGAESRIRELFRNDSCWTDFMLSSEAGLLANVATCLKSSVADLEYYGREIYSIDATLVGGIRETDLLGRGDQGYPARLYALIEHENGDAVEEEMWKLLWWRSPLKVIIFYDYSAADCAKTTRFAQWLPTKLKMLERMRADVSNFHPEDPATEYLLVVGQLTDARGIPSWNHIFLPVVPSSG